MYLHALRGHYAKCLDGYSADAENVCVPCTGGCKTCDPATPAKCLTCPTGKNLKSDNTCGDCPATEYAKA